MIYFDHLKLVRRELREVKKFRDWLLSAQVGEVQAVAVLHEHNNCCCRREKWRITARKLTEAIKPATPTVMIQVGEEP